jgi:hypothetical protein
VNFVRTYFWWFAWRPFAWALVARGGTRTVNGFIGGLCRFHGLLFIEEFLSSSGAPGGEFVVEKS